MKKVIMMMLVMSSITTGIFAQQRSEGKQITEEQKEQMKAVRDKYSPKMAEIKNEMHVIMTEQKALLSSKSIDEKAVYANIDKMGILKTDMQKQMLSMRSEMKTICPEMSECKGGKRHQAQQGGEKGKQMHGEKGGKRGQGEAKQCEGQCKAKDTPKKEQSCSKEQCSKAEARGNKGHKGAKLDLTDEQKAEVAEIKKAHFWTIQELENEISVLRAKAKGAEDQLASIDEISALQTKLAKEKMSVKLEVIDILTEEQRMKSIAMYDRQMKSHKGSDKPQGKRR